VHTLSPENQICHRLVHDAIGHGDCLLASSSCRLYYFSVLVNFYRDRIDWPAMLENLRKKEIARLLLAYVYYGARELGLTPPSELAAFRAQGTADVRLLDAVVQSPHRLANYSNRTVLAVLMSRRRSEQINNICRSFARQSWAYTVNGYQVVFLLKMLCLQLLAALYISSYRLRHPSQEHSPYVGSVV
jgi:hypothetical protein